MLAIINFLNDKLWSPAMIVFCFFVALYFSFSTKFVQIRQIKRMVKLLIHGDSSDKGVSSFQAFSMAISGRVGTGNIVGVATAIASGGPGAIFWMWIYAFLGPGTAFAESILAQIYKEDMGAQYRGGPAYYIRSGIKNKELGKVLAAGFAFSCAFANIVLMPGVQANSISSALYNAFNIPQAVSGAFVVILLGIIIFGGVKRIARTAEIIAPIMTVFYALVAIIILIMNASAIPETFALIFKSAFGLDAVFGGMLGSAITMGVKRGLYSSEAGMGTSPHSAAAAESSHPVNQALVQAFSVYIDTLVVCTATAIIILITNSYNVVDAAGNVVVNYLGDVEAGVIFTQMGVASVFGEFGKGFVAIALFFFAFTTLMAGYYNGETSYAYFLDKTKENKTAYNISRAVFLVATLMERIELQLQHGQWQT